ncbi:hypothetical protein [Dietzia sp. 179-F 9C3 NHS]|uniref:hypothetical protein n=1 Tax=Dietzia sp. 179-F 9C3 NHS TaxID=3374295 RepID=UPI00387A600F
MGPSERSTTVHGAVHDAVAATVRLGAVTTIEAAQLVVDHTVGRLLDTDPDRVR